MLARPDSRIFWARAGNAWTTYVDFDVMLTLQVDEYDKSVSLFFIPLDVLKFRFGDMIFWEGRPRGRTRGDGSAGAGLSRS